jgi:potassium/hydrogen antiporter
MTTSILITICSLLLVAYIFDLTAAKTKVPSVILLLWLGWVVRQFMLLFDQPIPNLSPFLPIFGTIGLILIVLEGSLELEVDRSKFNLIKKTILVSVVPMVALSFLLALLFQAYTSCSLKVGLINAIPLCVISSAIAIPSVRNLNPFNKEFIIYESSLSDIFGVLFFNFVTLNEKITGAAFAFFGLEMLLIVGISFVATLALAFLIGRIDHHIKFIPITLLVILIYNVSKVYHLPALVFILLFGLFLGNLDAFKNTRWIQKLRPTELNKEVHKFKEITIEGTFLIRALFFLLFGFLMKTADILNLQTFIWAVGIVAAIFAIRAGQLRWSKVPLMPLLFIAPRGLITILLFLSITPATRIPIVNKSLIIQVMILTALVMMMGIMFQNKGGGKGLTGQPGPV